ncbi:hypothetical protein CTAYLR_000446 [Chrysophaeum taylorii]|uniref:CRAL-TRIO domain-containing protein n=1 Tax=Chrysophaeum taylorii TaxID=2483200 RepID=A0AAD7UFY3_9STRA|nr:hypothetical protein CTAYLR_000446 [Chrysophaeum taylorii]
MAIREKVIAQLQAKSGPLYDAFLPLISLLERKESEIAALQVPAPVLDEAPAILDDEGLAPIAADLEDVPVPAEPVDEDEPEPTIADEDEPALLGDDEAQVPEDEARVPEDEARVAEDEARVAEDEARVAEDEARVAEDEARVAEDEARVAEDEGVATDEPPTGPTTDEGADPPTKKASSGMTRQWTHTRAAGKPMQSEGPVQRLGELCEDCKVATIMADKPHMEALAKAFPDAPLEEVRRFANARDTFEESCKLLKRYRRWRADEGAPSALESRAAPVRDRLFMTAGGVDERGDVVVMIEGARYDTGVAPEAYAAFVCATLDSLLEAESPRRLVVLIDVRAGNHWPNPPPHQLVPFIRCAAKLLADAYPERLRKVAVYPLPYVFRVLASWVLGLLDPVTRNKILVLGTGETASSRSLFSPASPRSPFSSASSTTKKPKQLEPCPVDELRTIVSLDLLPEHARDRHEGL